MQLRAMRGGSKTETAGNFSVSEDTVRAWFRRANDDSLVQSLPEDRVAICPAHHVIAVTTPFQFACIGIHAEGRWTRSRGVCC